LGVGRVPILVGPTGVGKTAVALALAERLPIEVVSADSRQVYRRLDIATAKPTPRDLARLPHHGLDQVDPGRRYSAGQFARDAPRWITDIRVRGRQPVVVGGTGLYVRALVDGLFVEPPLDSAGREAIQVWAGNLSPAELVRHATRLDPGFHGGGRQRATRAIEVAFLTGWPLSHWQRVARTEGAVAPWHVLLTVPRPVLQQRIAHRASQMMARGLIEEVAAVLSEGHPPRAPGLDTIGVREAVEYLHGHRSRDSVAEAITVSTRRYAKRQETWFRHQLHGPVMALDGSRPAEAVAEDIVTAWREDAGP